MMNRSVQHERVQDAMREDGRDVERTIRLSDGRLTRRWSRRMSLDDTYRAPALFTWRC